MALKILSSWREGRRGRLVIIMAAILLTSTGDRHVMGTFVHLDSCLQPLLIIKPPTNGIQKHHENERPSAAKGASEPDDIFWPLSRRKDH